MVSKATIGWEGLKFVVMGIAAVIAWGAREYAEEATREAEAAKEAAVERATQSEFDLKAYELVKEALTRTDRAANGYGIAAAAMVNALTHPPLRDQLLSALRAGATEPALLKQLDDAGQFDLESERLDSVPSDTVRRSKRAAAVFQSEHRRAFTLVSVAWAQIPGGLFNGYRIDLLYCEARSANETAARKARANRDRLRLGGDSVFAQVRLLPTLVQARPEYQSFSDEVRYNDDKDERVADSLARVLGFRQTSLRRFDAGRSKYIAAFYCARSS